MGQQSDPSRAAAIVGLGLTDLGRVYGKTSPQFAADAARLALADAGLQPSDVDGLLLSSGVTGGVSLPLQKELGLGPLRLMSQVIGFGTTAVQQIQYAAMAIAAGMAEVVVCVHGDAPLQPGLAAGESYRRNAPALKGLAGMAAAAGLRGANPAYALATRRHMDRFGTTSEQLGNVAIAQRAWAAMNPRAQMREPITLEDHQSSRWIVEPLHLLDCCLVSNGGIAVVVTSVERARDLPSTPVYLWGWGQGHPGNRMERGSDFGITTGATVSGPAALRMAGIGLADVEICELYDCYTFTVLITLEDYGFCEKGEGGKFVSSGVLGPGGALPTNTGGGQISGYYLWGMTPLSEGIIQARGEGGERQVPKHDVVLVSGNGGILDYHSTLILSPQPKS